MGPENFLLRLLIKSCALLKVFPSNSSNALFKASQSIFLSSHDAIFSNSELEKLNLTFPNIVSLPHGLAQSIFPICQQTGHCL